VVISIIALLVSILLPALSNARQSAQSIQCSNNLRTVGMGYEIYAHENSDYMPSSGFGASDWGMVLGAAGTIGGPISYPGFNGTTPTTLNSFKVLECPSEYGVSNMGGWDINGATMFRYFTHRNSYAVNWLVGGYTPYADLRKGWSRGPQWSGSFYYWPTASGPSDATLVVDRTAYGAGFWQDGSFAWGIDDSYAVQPDAEYAFRHTGGTANVLYWDGHVVNRPPALGSTDPSKLIWTIIFDPLSYEVGPLAGPWSGW